MKHAPAWRELKGHLCREHLDQRQESQRSQSRRSTEGQVKEAGWQVLRAEDVQVVG
jgi:hypothetical protein